MTEGDQPYSHSDPYFVSIAKTRKLNSLSFYSVFVAGQWKGLQGQTSCARTGFSQPGLAPLVNTVRIDRPAGGRVSSEREGRKADSIKRRREEIMLTKGGCRDVVHVYIYTFKDLSRHEHTQHFMYRREMRHCVLTMGSAQPLTTHQPSSVQPIAAADRPFHGTDHSGLSALGTLGQSQRGAFPCPAPSPPLTLAGVYFTSL
ncbi:hypothetical protein E2C01_057718 [Portunus trituberculatus]|uniref:Uncharacterized protein n=1 Tax=Portunus trituberculatus TaxID=210409 RepID=A0A5B7H3E3_PORTR|nr:hypothetical protein [Portunus trituberculatus]